MMQMLMSHGSRGFDQTGQLRLTEPRFLCLDRRNTDPKAGEKYAQQIT